MASLEVAKKAFAQAGVEPKEHSLKQAKSNLIAIEKSLQLPTFIHHLDQGKFKVAGTIVLKYMINLKLKRVPWELLELSLLVLPLIVKRKK